MCSDESLSRFKAGAESIEWFNDVRAAKPRSKSSTVRGFAA
jgi:hypothetical protein